MNPVLVNFKALPTRFTKIWRIRPGSPSTASGKAGSITTLSSSPFSWICRVNRGLMVSIKSFGESICCSRAGRPDSMRLKSKISSRMRRDSSPPKTRSWPVPPRGPASGAFFHYPDFPGALPRAAHQLAILWIQIGCLEFHARRLECRTCAVKRIHLLIPHEHSTYQIQVPDAGFVSASCEFGASCRDQLGLLHLSAGVSGPETGYAECKIIHQFLQQLQFILKTEMEAWITNAL